MSEGGPLVCVFHNWPVTMDKKAAEAAATSLLQRNDLKLLSLEELQSLWAGYGSVYAITATPHDATREGSTIRLIMKIITPPSTAEENEGHIRKMLSYRVEQFFYEEVSNLLENDVTIAKCWQSCYSNGGIDDSQHPNIMATILADLRDEFPVAGEKRSSLTKSQVYAAIEWLSKFHKASKHLLKISYCDLIKPPLQEASKHTARYSLWLNGGYTYLATRRSEYESLLEDISSEWATVFCKALPGKTTTLAEQVAAFLTPNGKRAFETCIHGDVKSENMFSSASGDRVAFFDFQYVGMGLGVCDLAKLFTCSVPLSMLTSKAPDTITRLKMDVGEKQLLQLYWNTYQNHRKSAEDSKYAYDWQLFCRHWETALVDWCRFQASWGFWGNTSWLQARVRSIVLDQGWRIWLESELQ